VPADLIVAGEHELAGAALRLEAGDEGGDQVATAHPSLLAQRKATQPTNKRTFGSVFKNPEGGVGAGRLIEGCGLKGHRVGGALISPRHANFIENAGDARSADAIALMAEARQRAWDQYGLALRHEVEVLGPLELPPLGRSEPAPGAAQ